MPFPILAIKLAGIISILFGVFHLFFENLFDWREDFKGLSASNAKILYTIHFFLIPFFFFFGGISIYFTEDLTNGAGLTQAILRFCAAFWILRALWQILYFDISKMRSKRSRNLHLIIFSLAAMAGTSYLLALIA